MSSDSITVLNGKSVRYTVSASGFITQTGTIDNIEDSQSLDIFLIGGKLGVKKLVATDDTTWYINADDELYGCGLNANGQQGSGNIADTLTFTKRAENVKDVQCSDTETWYLTNDGELWGTGYNNNGQQGSGNTTDVKTFTKRAENVKKFVLNFAYDDNSYTTWYITNDGDLYGCGLNVNGQQGSGYSGSGQYVTAFYKRASNVKDVFTSSNVTWYITNDGDLYGCGSNSSGMQGNGQSGGNVTTFTKRASNVKKVMSDNLSTWYLTNTNELYGCGSNGVGQQGSGNTTDVKTFTKRAENVKDVFITREGGLKATWYINNNNELYGTGYNGSGQQGSGDTTTVTVFTKRAENVKTVRVTNNSTWYINNNNELYGCGANDSGQQGSGDTTDITTFTKIAENVKDIQATQKTTWYITESGDLYGCGFGYYGQQGNGGTGSVRTFTKRASNVKEVQCRENMTWYITNDNELYGTGYGSRGEQGSGKKETVKTFTRRVIGRDNTAKLTINPTPADAIVTINSETTNELDIIKGMSANWSVSKTGYTTQSGTIAHIYDDTNLDIILESK